jgi:hypothetical protein
VLSLGSGLWVLLPGSGLDWIGFDRSIDSINDIIFTLCERFCIFSFFVARYQNRKEERREKMFV